VTDLQKLCDEANAACNEWEQTKFYLGSPFMHCEKLRSFAAPELLEALKSREVQIEMLSEYYPPRFKVEASGHVGG